MGDILFLAHRIPYPPDKGDKIRSWNILKYVAERAPVHLGAFVDDPDDLAHEDMLRSICKSVKLIPIGKRERMARIAEGLLNGAPLSTAIYDDREMKAWVWERIKRDDIDRVFVFSSQMAPYALGHTAEARHIVMDFVDIDSDKFAQYASESRWPKSWVYAREARLLGDFEKQVARHVEQSLFVSDAETAMFRRIAGSYAHHIDTLENGVDLDYFKADAGFDPVAVEGAPRLVFTGAMDYRPNVDAVLWFAEEVMPIVARTLSGAHLTIVGGKPAPAVVSLGKRSDVTVTGRVPDVRPYIAAADVAVAPIRIARGVQNKVLEAMAMARPVVATTMAWSGISAERGHDLIVRDEAANFAAAIVDVYGDPVLSTKLGANARQCMVRNYAWPAQLSKLDRWLRLETAREVAA